MFFRDTTFFKLLTVCLLDAMVSQVMLPVAYGHSLSFVERTSFRVSDHDFRDNSVSLLLSGLDSVESGNRGVVFFEKGVSEVLESTGALGGPGQVESSSFSLSSSSEMVDAFTGDFSYSIPLMDVEGYPIVLSYSSNVGMMDESSWVGLGWSLNLGSVSRSMRGVPDDFDGSENIESIHSILEDNTTNGTKVGGTLGVMYKGSPLPKKSQIGTDFSVLFGGYDNAYTGYSRTFDFNVGASLAIGKPAEDEESGKMLGLRGGLGYSSDSKNGIGRSFSGGFSASYMNPGKSSVGFSNLGLSFGSNYHSRSGVTQRSINLGISYARVSSNNFVSGFSAGVIGSTFTLGTSTYIPRFEMSSRSQSNQFIIDLSNSYTKNPSARWGFVVGLEAQTYNSTQTFVYKDAASKTILNPAFGYFHSQKRSNYIGLDSPIMDFNRERDSEFSEAMTNLPYSFPTYDIFYANGMGMNATFRGQRNDVGVYRDANNTNDSEGSTHNIVAGKNTSPDGNSLVLGYTYSGSIGEAESGQWSMGSEVFAFGPDDSVHFKGIGELTPKKSNVLGELGGESAVALLLDKTEVVGTSINKTQIMRDKNNVNSSLFSSSVTAQNIRDDRAVIYDPLRADEVTTGLANYTIHPVNTFHTYTPSVFSRIGAHRLPSHLSAIEITNASGMHYYYGLPSYSLSQSDIVFSTDQTQVNSSGVIVYGPTDNTILNDNGRMHLFDKMTVPSYSTSFLLTGITSSDYVDISNDGFSLDDVGEYYKVNYSLVYDQTNPFKWRFPYDESTSFLNQGLLGSDLDNTGSYSYGEKEIWYAHSLESRNLVAEFTLEDRQDMYSVVGEQGVFDTSKPLKRLHKITLYNRSERLEKKGNAVPLQVIEFEYDYSLCPDYPLNPLSASGNNGKLTLKSIRVYSGPISEENALHPYVFEYSTVNPSFHYEHTDRWGNYVETLDANRPLTVYPSSPNDPLEADKQSRAWKLVKITSPGGAEMEVSYESDNYRYVQNKLATTHIDVKGFTTPAELNHILNTNTWDETSYVGKAFQKSISLNSASTFLSQAVTTLTSYQAIIQNNIVGGVLDVYNDDALYAQLDELPCNVVVFELSSPIDAQPKTAADLLFRETYLKEEESLPEGQGYMKEVYLRSMVEVEANGPYELVPTFAKIKQSSTGVLNFYGSHPMTGLLPASQDGTYKYGYIVLENVISSEDELRSIAMSPIQKTALEFSRLHLPDVVYDASVGQSGDLTVDKKAFWRGDLYRYMAKAGFCSKIDNNRPSQIRLTDHDRTKYGGNGRVSKITIRDNWTASSGEYGSEYSWKYNYEADRFSAIGVAAFEPTVGMDENAFYKWSRYTNKSVSFPDESRFTVMPIGSTLYPSPVIGYPTVRIRVDGREFLDANNGSTSQGDLGYLESSYYTSYDYPTHQESTSVQRIKADKNSIFKEEIDLYGFSQGHTLITNDFHGKPKGSALYDKFGVLQGRTTYNYRVLGAKIPMLNSKGVVTDELVGTEVDVSVDSRFIESTFKSGTMGVQVSLNLPSFIIDGISPIFTMNSRKVGYYGHVINKHINYSAIVESIITESFGSVNTARNELYDKSTGAVLLSSLTDEFNDELYSLSYPLHWYYTLFRSPLSKVTPVIGSFSGSNFVSSVSIKDQLTVGDYIKLTNGGTTKYGYVIWVDGTSARFIDDTPGINQNNSLTLSGSCTVSVVKSGRKNILTGSMQSVVTKRNPFNDQTNELVFPSSDILESSAVTLRPRLNVLCAVGDAGLKNSVTLTSKINPFKYGLLNNLIVEHNYSPQLERSSVASQGIRFNGTYVGYYSFYALNSQNDWVQIDESTHPNSDLTNLRNWRPSGEVTVTDEYGRPIESRDQIRVSSAVLYGYNRYNKLLPVAEAVNAKKHEIAYDSFDDYNYMNSSSVATFKGHFDFAQAIIANPSKVSLSNTIRHSGVSSLALGSLTTASVTRSVTKPTSCTSDLDSFTATSYTVDSCMCVKGFEPEAGKKYLISAWVRGGSKNSASNYSDCSIQISYTGSGTVETILPSGQLLDGWQRVEYSFTIPSGATGITVSLRNTSSDLQLKAYFDDIRIHPFLAGMSTTVYDPQTLLPLATHDAYNFTTYYGYDENLQPVRVRIETINGIQTITESEGGSLIDYK